MYDYCDCNALSLNECGCTAPSSLHKLPSGTDEVHSPKITGRLSGGAEQAAERRFGRQDDIAVRLRRHAGWAHIDDTWVMLRLAADEIERLRAIARYAEHRDNCEQPYSASKRVCNCGLSDLLEARCG